MDNKTLNKELENLLLTKDYESLTEVEKGLAIQYLTEVEYESFRRILLVTFDTDNNNILSEKPEDKDKLFDIFDYTYNKPKSSQLNRIVQFSVPLYKFVAGMALILSTAYLINMKFFPSSHERIVYITDTIYKEILVPENVWLADSSTKAEYFDTDTGILKNSSNDFDAEGRITGDKKPLGDLYDMEILAKQFGLITDRDIIAFRNKQNRGRSLIEDSTVRGLLVSLQ